MKARLFNKIAAVALALPACLFLASSLNAQNSPVGTWDFLISGSARGIAYITFSDDFTFAGYEVLVPRLASGSGEDDSNEARNDGSTIGRIITPSNPSSGGGTAKTNLIGFGLVSGQWTFDSSGHVLGIYTEGNDNVSCTTNTVFTEVFTSYTTNINGTNITVFESHFETNFVTTCVTNAITNGVSFTAIVKLGVRMTLKTTSDNGKTVLRGVPAVGVSDISDSYYAIGRKSGQSFIELLTITPSANYFNAFDIIGTGPGYDVLGIALLSSKNQIAIVKIHDVSTTMPNDLTALIGPINVTKGAAKLRGEDVNRTRVRYDLNATQ